MHNINELFEMLDSDNDAEVQVPALKKQSKFNISQYCFSLWRINPFGKIARK